VIERPASVVKELVENALDAEASVVHVEVEAGGKSLIRVRDDGLGMAREDAILALERHATSKLSELRDLQDLTTHGFRGEALPSIASISHLVLRTRPEETAAGTEVDVRFGGRADVRDAGHPRGTTVEVRDLFGSVPARRKFLRVDSTEAAHVAEAVTLLALARPERGFFLRSGDRAVVEAPPVDALGPRLFQLFGGSLLEALTPVDGGKEWARVSGFVSRTSTVRGSRPNLRLFVNRRPVRDRAVAKAVAEAYRRAGVGDRGFEAFLSLELPAHLVDVNVHPAKTEVRFADARTVFAAVEDAVEKALSAGSRHQVGAAGPLPRNDVAPREATLVQGRLASGVPVMSAGYRYGEATLGEGRVEDAPARGPAAEGARDLVVLGQHRETYIVATDGEELVLVDQHTAHERVRFEALLAGSERRSGESQLLLTPAIVSLAPELRPLLEESLDSLRSLGYDVEPFGGGELRLRAVPALLGGRDPQASLDRLLRDLREREGGDWAVAGRRDRLAATLACHSAVRAGQALGVPAMTAIVRDLQQTAHPALCPHGRPTMARIFRDELSRLFGRTGWARR
jgi:DNA mismatch repair protein MutL